LDKGISTLRSNGQWQKISDKYFAGTDIWGD
jgi:ABC-type amino acid transport substrate-binding protein